MQNSMILFLAKSLKQARSVVESRGPEPAAASGAVAYRPLCGMKAGGARKIARSDAGVATMRVSRKEARCLSLLNRRKDAKRTCSDKKRPPVIRRSMHSSLESARHYRLRRADTVRL